MSSRLAYRLALILMFSPVVIIPGLIAFRMHECHLLNERMQAQVQADIAQQRAEMEAKIAQMKADQRAQNTK